MRNLRLTLAYDGADFSGWQFQPHLRTVQGTLEEAMRQVTGVWTRVHGSSRTDAGVHALGQVASLTTPTRLDNATLRKALNAVLPFDLAVIEVADAPEGFHATRDAVRKRYRYVLQDGQPRDPLGRAYSWHIPVRLDDDAMRTAARHLLGEHDFKAFQTTGSARESTVRTIYDLTIERRPLETGPRLVIEVEANGFLYNMVRNIAGTLMSVGRARHAPDWVAEVLVSRDRRRAGMAAPAEGLFLLWIKFPE
jgi:tRNA pseudouridine38-40 synthase